MTIDFGEQIDLLDSIVTSSKPVVFLVGSAIATAHPAVIAGVDGCGDPGVPGVGGVIDLIRQELGQSTALSRLEQKIASAKNSYSAAFTHLVHSRNQDAANRVIRRAVMTARRQDPAWSDRITSAIMGDLNACAELEEDVDGWGLPPAVRYLGILLRNHVSKFGKRVITTNFDPLIRVAVRKAGGEARSLALDSDGSLGKTEPNGTTVVHLHGHWYKSDTLHMPQQLEAERERLRAALSGLIGDHMVVVVGYGGWKDAFMKTLVQAVYDESINIDVRWCFFESDRYKIEHNNEELLKDLRPGMTRGRVVFYSGINAHDFFPALVAQLGPIATPPDKPGTVGNTGGNPTTSNGAGDTVDDAGNATVSQSIQSYLSAVSDYCAASPYLSLRSIDPHRTLPELYVPLRAREPAKKPDNQKKNDKANQILREIDLSIAEVIQDAKEGRIVILGDPGSGKSSMLRHLAGRAWEQPATIGLAKPHLPLIVSLPDLAAQKGSFEERIATIMRSELSFKSEPPDLIAGFLERWSKQGKAKWLFLFDALDEVPAKIRDKFLKWLNDVLKHLESNKFVLTTRASGYSDADFQLAHLKQYTVLPFSYDQVREFSEKWFESKAKAFCDKLGSLVLDNEEYTPLLLTIAAKVFGENEDLPGSRSRLYKAYIDIVAGETSRRCQEEQIDARLLSILRFLLQQLALLMARTGGNPSFPESKRLMTDTIRRILARSYEEASADAERCQAVLLRHSGVLIQKNRTLRFVHPTIQEYFAAEAIAYELEQGIWEGWNAVAPHWRKRQWREVILFVLGIWSDDNNDVGILLHRIAPNRINRAKLLNVLAAEFSWRAFDGIFHPNGYLVFVADAVRYGVNVDSSEQDRAAECCLVAIEAIDDVDIVPPAFSVLRLLRNSPAALRGLRDIINDEDMGYYRYLAMVALIDLGGAGENEMKLLLSWGSQPSHQSHAYVWDGETRLLIAKTFARMGRKADSFQVLNSLVAEEYGQDRDLEEVRTLALVDCFRLIGEGVVPKSDIASVIDAISNLIKNPTISEVYVENFFRYAVIRSLPIEKLLYDVVQDNCVPDFRRCDAAIAMVSICGAEQGRRALSKLSRVLEDSYARHYARTQLELLNSLGSEFEKLPWIPLGDMSDFDSQE